MKSQYKYVRYQPFAMCRTKSQDAKAELFPWRAVVTMRDDLGGQFCVSTSKTFATEREAAIHVDRILLEHGREPVNILKRKEP